MALSALPQIQRKRLQITKDVVPPGLRSLDYWQIMDYWKVFDRNGDGMMDKNEFFFLVNRMNPDPVERPLSDQIFACVDVDRSGEIDCEEFLSWIFQMYAPYSGGLRERLGDMNPSQVVDYFKRIDTNGNGELDKGEFRTFIARFLPEAHLSERECNDLFDVIDKDGSGEIDAHEFVRWVYPGLGEGESGLRRGARERGASRGASKNRGDSKASGSRMPTIDTRTSKDRPGRLSRREEGQLSSSRSEGALLNDRRAAMGQQPVVLEFTIGPDFRQIMLEIERAFSKRLAESVSTKIIIDNQTRGCSRFVLRVGRGVVLWDKPSMIAHRDNPFETFDSSRNFVMETIKERMPTLLRATRR
jgi:Ca2+-binding EF-hand superfamily protein